MLNFHEFSLLEYSNKVKYMLNTKFKKENPQLTDTQIEYYIDKFENKKSSPIIKEKDITKYTFAELESLIDSNFSKSTSILDKNFENEAIYNENGLTIYDGDTKEKCIKYGQGEAWCTSRTDTSNMYNTYRYRMNEVTLYFVFDSERSDAFSKIVILVDKNNNYYLANKDNSGDFSGSKQISWEEIVKHQPKISNLKYLFEPKPLTENDRNIYNMVKDRTNDDLVEKFKSFDLIEHYISMQHVLTNEQFQNIHHDLQLKYINVGHSLSDTQFELCSSDLRIRHFSVMGINGNKVRMLSKKEANKYIEININSNKGGFIYKYIENIPFGFELPRILDGDFQLTTQKHDIEITKEYPITNLVLPHTVNGDFRISDFNISRADKNNFKLEYPKIINGNFAGCFMDGVVLPEYVDGDCLINTPFNISKIKLPNKITGDLIIKTSYTNLTKNIIYPKYLGGKIAIDYITLKNPKYFKGKLVPIISDDTELKLNKLGFNKSGSKYVLQTNSNLYHISDIEEQFVNELDYYNVKSKIPTSVSVLLTDKKIKKDYRIPLDKVSDYIDNKTLYEKYIIVKLEDFEKHKK